MRDALDYVWGYTVVNDITARDIQFTEAQWSRCKSFDGFTPTGPVRRHRRRDRRPAGPLASRRSSTATSCRTPRPARWCARSPTIIAHLSRSATLLPGTLISTGSPGGAGYSRDPQVFLRDGSTVTVAIEGIGSLTTHCRDRSESSGRPLRRATLGSPGLARSRSLLDGSPCRSITGIAVVIGSQAREPRRRELPRRPRRGSSGPPRRRGRRRCGRSASAVLASAAAAA